MKNPSTSGPLKNQCSAHKKDGERCRRAPIRGGNVCRVHGGAAPQVRRSAQKRIADAAEDAASYLVRWMGDDEVELRMRVGIAQDLLTRAGISGKTSVEVEVKRYEQLITDGAILVDFDQQDEPVEAELVEDGLPALTAGADEAYYDGGRSARTPSPSSRLPRGRGGRPMTPKEQ